MADLTTTGLRVALEVARTGSITGAADRLGYTQSAVSRQVAATERAAGVALFERQARGVRLTAAGEVLVRHAAVIVDGLAALEGELAGMRDRLGGTLVVGAFPTALATILPRAIRDLRQRHPGLQVRIEEGSSPQLVRKLTRGRIELALVATGDGLPDLDLAGLTVQDVPGRGEFGVAVSAEHRFAHRQWVTPAELADQTWVAGASTAQTPEFEAWPLLEHPDIAYVVRDWPARLGLVAAGLGIALVPGLAADLVPAGVRWVPVRTSDDDPRVERRLRVVLRAEPGPGAVALAESIRARAERLD